jgi:hypothetical protein
MANGINKDAIHRPFIFMLIAPIPVLEIYECSNRGYEATPCTGLSSKMGIALIFHIPRKMQPESCRNVTNRLSIHSNADRFCEEQEGMP